MTNQEIKQKILFIEQNFDVNSWEVEGIKFWPIIRVKLFFYLFRKHQEVKVFKQNIEVERKFSFLYKAFAYLKAPFFYFFLKRSKYLFYGDDSHRVNYKGVRYNRFFDTYIDFNKIQDKVTIIDADNKPTGEKYLAERHLDNKFQLFIEKKFFSKKVTYENIKWGDFKKFEQFILNDEELIGFYNIINSDRVIDFFNQSFLPLLYHYKKVLKKIQPLRVILLCFYTSEGFALTCAANTLGIETIEMQHGPQSQLHMAYSSWLKLPSEGYDLLPRNYWCWNNESVTTFESLTLNSKYNAKVAGNFWVNYWSEKIEKINNLGYIYYTLQMYDVEKHFPLHLLNFIKENDYKWVVRIHPRQNHAANRYILFFKKNDIIDKITIENPNIKPLPEGIMNSLIHITNYSGSTIEASLLNKKTILINKVALQTFNDLIEKEQAYFVDVDSDNFKNELKKVLENQI